MAETTQSQDDELLGELEKGSPLVERIGLFAGPVLAAVAFACAPSLGLSRDDAAPILTNYIDKGVFEVDPFVSIDQRSGPPFDGST